MVQVLNVTDLEQNDQAKEEADATGTADRSAAASDAAVAVATPPIEVGGLVSVNNRAFTESADGLQEPQSSAPSFGPAKSGGSYIACLIEDIH